MCRAKTGGNLRERGGSRAESLTELGADFRTVGEPVAAIEGVGRGQEPAGPPAQGSQRTVADGRQTTRIRTRIAWLKVPVTELCENTTRLYSPGGSDPATVKPEGMNCQLTKAAATSGR